MPGVAKQKVRQMAKEMDQMKTKPQKVEDSVVIEEASRNVIEVALEDAFQRVHLTAIEITTKMRWKNGGGGGMGEEVDKVEDKEDEAMGKSKPEEQLLEAEKQMTMKGRKDEYEAKEDEVDKNEAEKEEVDKYESDGVDKDEADEDKGKKYEGAKQEEVDKDEADSNKADNIEADLKLAKQAEADRLKIPITEGIKVELLDAAEEGGRKRMIERKDGMKMERKEETTNEEAKDKVEIRRKAASIAVIYGPTAEGRPFEGIKKPWVAGNEKKEGKCCEGGGEDDDETVGLLEEDEQADADVEEDDITDTVL